MNNLNKKINEYERLRDEHYPNYDNTKYFEVEEGKIKAPIRTHVILSDGTYYDDYEVTEEIVEILIWYRVTEFRKDGSVFNIKYYNVCNNGKHNNRRKVLEQIKNDHQPDDGWQNNDW